MRGLALIVFLGLAATAAAAVAGGHGDRPPARPVATAAAGSFELENSRSGEPIFAASGIGPGDGASGTVEIANEGDEPGELRLSQDDVVDTPGAGGGLLSRRLSLRIRDVSDPGKPQPVYAGALAPMPTLALGLLGPGQSRAFEFVAALADSGTPLGAAAGDNAFQGAAVSVTYAWTAAEPAPGSEVASGSGLSSTALSTVTVDRARQLVILRVRASLWHRRLVLWAYCGPRPCPLQARLRFHAGGPRRSPGKTLGLLVRQRLVEGSQRLVFKLPARLRRALRAAVSKGRRPTVRVVLVLRDREAARASARKAVRLRHLYPGARNGRR